MDRSIAVSILVFGCNTGPSFDSIAAPAVACTPVDAGLPITDASDASSSDFSAPGCRPPAAHCTGGDTLAYFSNGRCVDGGCTWVKKPFRCVYGCEEIVISDASYGACKDGRPTPPAQQPPGYPY